MSFTFPKFRTKLFQGSIDLDSDDIRAMLLMSDETVGAEPNTEFLADFTDLDELDSASYARKVMTTLAIIEQLANDRSYLNSDVVNWTTLEPASRQVVALLIFKLVNDDADSIPIAYINNIETFPFVPDNNNVTIGPSTVAGAEGWVEITQVP